MTFARVGQYTDQIDSTTATIAGGASVSGAVYLGGYALFGNPGAQALALQGYVAQYVASQETLDQATVQAGVDASIGKVIPAAV